MLHQLLYINDSLILTQFKIGYMQKQDELLVEDTNEEALASKISAIKKGYFVDKYAEEFTQYRGKRDIIIHRGYWARVHIVRRLIESMLKHGQNVQIVSLGCGLETLWFNLMDEGLITKKFRFVELDLECVVKKKIKKINHSKKLAALFQKLQLKPVVSQHQHQLVLGEGYVLAACDLSNISQIQSIIDTHKIDPSLPTFFYSECVLSYIEANRVDEMITYIGKRFDFAFFFDYEMYNPNDRFGQLMVKNFAARGCPLVGIYKYPELSNQKDRYVNAGFKRTEVFTMQQIYYDCIDKLERQKIEKIEMLDELQEWNLIMGHYFGLLSVHYNQKGEKHPSFGELMQSVKLKI